MISIWHLIWICPLSAVAGVVLAVGIIIFDDCLWLASNKSETRGDENRDNQNCPDYWKGQTLTQLRDPLVSLASRVFTRIFKK